MAPRLQAGDSARAQRGVTYIGLLIAVAMIGTAAAASALLWSTASRRDREAELLFVGAQFAQAIASYRDQAPAGQPQQFPRRLDDLLDDRRWPVTRRHLRRIWVDPITGRADWGLVAAPGGGFIGVHSLSAATPLKRANFGRGFEDFANAASYRDWVFGYDTLVRDADDAQAAPGVSRAASVPGR
jgi:type II secretory pathway pseudopilin PulG